MVPGVGFVADLANGFWYLSEGDYFSAASSFVSAVPGIGDVAGGIAKAITGCTKISKAIKFATRFASKIGNFALGAYSTATQIYGLWDKYVIKGQPFGQESLGEFFGAAFTGVSTVLSGKGVVDDIANYSNVKYDILTSQCFVEGTLIVTDEGDKPIEEIQAGDLVYSTNPETGESEYKEVLRTFRKESDVLIHIFVNGEEIQTTPVHPFWVEDQWVAAKDLETGDILTLADGSTAPITRTYGEKLDETVIVYNFEVSEFHTYYVTDTGVLVHNDEKYSKSKKTKNWRGDEVNIPEGHTMSPRDPDFSEKPIYKKGPFTSAQRNSFLKGKSGGTKIAPHHRHQIPVRDGGVIDELGGPGYPGGNEHTAGSPNRHPASSIFKSDPNGELLRQQEIRDYWKSKGQRLIELLPGEWYDPGY